MSAIISVRRDFSIDFFIYKAKIQKKSEKKSLLVKRKGFLYLRPQNYTYFVYIFTCWCRYKFMMALKCLMENSEVWVVVTGMSFMLL